MIRGVDSILLYVRDVDDSLRYYRDRLGFTPSFFAPEEGGVAGLQVGNIRMILHTDQDLRPDNLQPSGERVQGRGVILHFEVEDVDRYHADLVGRGVEISLAPTEESWGARAMYLYDPDGYNICFLQRPVATEGQLA